MAATRDRCRFLAECVQVLAQIKGPLPPFSGTVFVRVLCTVYICVYVCLLHSYTPIYNVCHQVIQWM